jgi:hypothetical protein
VAVALITNSVGRQKRGDIVPQSNHSVREEKVYRVEKIVIHRKQIHVGSKGYMFCVCLPSYQSFYLLTL